MHIVFKLYKSVTLIENYIYSSFTDILFYLIPLLVIIISLLSTSFLFYLIVLSFYKLAKVVPLHIATYAEIFLLLDVKPVTIMITVVY